MTSVAMWKPPARREYKPKPMDPGQVIVWTVRIGAHWTVPPRYDSEAGTFTGGIGWVETVEYERIGTIWSEAVSPSCWWVVPDDDERNPVVVRRAGKSHREYREGTLYQSGECGDWRQAIRRAENVRHRGAVFAVVDREEQSRSWSGNGTTWKTLTWHCDPHCPAAVGKPRDDGTGCAHGRYKPAGESWDMLSIADVMVGRIHLASPGPFCPRCIMLEPAAETARELVTA